MYLKDTCMFVLYFGYVFVNDSDAALCWKFFWDKSGIRKGMGSIQNRKCYRLVFRSTV